ncbi:MAG: hypothetical protein LBD25_03730 [Coriobacteriales bacterium]|nr:hypothetical protein [Coriobacteriales bacterium]
MIADFETLRTVALDFFDHAEAGNYCSPNREIPKAARAKWRFTVRRIIKSLVAVQGENSEEAALLLVEVYRMLSYACDYYLFSTEVPFAATGYSQPQLLAMVLEKLFIANMSAETIRLAVYIVLESHLDRDTISPSLIVLLADHMKTPRHATIRVGSM